MARKRKVLQSQTGDHGKRPKESINWQRSGRMVHQLYEKTQGARLGRVISCRACCQTMGVQTGSAAAARLECSHL